ncbi:MAG: alpha/beta fold hydrolase, partial [Oscillochloris sp.]|nr:alpha/beta fold hydrolase [Oscillochloris sp.]
MPSTSITFRQPAHLGCTAIWPTSRLRGCVRGTMPSALHWDLTPISIGSGGFMAQTNINGIRMRYDDVGQGPALLLLHAFPLSAAMWQPQVEALQDQFRLIVPDLRGFGGTDAPPGTYPMDEMADDLAALLDFLGIEQAALCGLSMGGYIAMAFLRHYPSRVRALILADTRAGADSDEARAAREANARLAESAGPTAIADKMIPGLVAPYATKAVRDTLRSLILANTPEGIAGALRGMAVRPDSTAGLCDMSVPTLVIV